MRHSEIVNGSVPKRKEPAARTCFVISDSDESSKYQEFPLYRRVKTKRSFAAEEYENDRKADKETSLGSFRTYKKLKNW